MPLGHWPPEPKRMETFTGSTDGSGLFSGTYSAPFSAVPMLTMERVPPADASVTLRPTVQTASGFTIIAERRAALSVLGLDVLASDTSTAASQSVKVMAVGD